MVVGLERFRDFFLDYGDQYVLIGGVAAMHWLEEAGLRPRATKDLDIVMLVEAGRTGFQRRFWEFIRNGGYGSCQKSTPDRNRYRFLAPAADDYPVMLEIFSGKPDGLDLAGMPAIVPIPGDEDASSLSAILMDESYHKIVKENVRTENGLSLLGPEGLILLKARAWLDLSRRLDMGGRVDRRDIGKHRTDVFKLALLLGGDNAVPVSRTVHADLLEFLGHFPPASPEWQNIRQSVGMGSRMPPPEVLLNAIKRNFAPID